MSTMTPAEWNAATKNLLELLAKIPYRAEFGPHRHVWHTEQQTGHTYCAMPWCGVHKNGWEDCT